MTVSHDRRFEVRTNPNFDHDALKDFTLILPCVSIGSVPQLAVDVLLENENAERQFGQRPVHVCDLDPRFCLPFVGPSNDDQVRTALQVFAFPRARIAVVQQRSPTLKTHKRAFVDALTAWVARRAFSECLLLVSADAALRGDDQLRHPDVGLYTVAQVGQQGRLSSTLAKLLPAYPSTSAAAAANTPSFPPPMSSAGLARQLLRRSAQDWLAVTTALLAFSAEGDNRADAFAMATVALRATLPDQARSNDQLIEPKDWQSLFGAPFQPGIF